MSDDFDYEVVPDGPQASQDVASEPVKTPVLDEAVEADEAHGAERTEDEVATVDALQPLPQGVSLR